MRPDFCALILTHGRPDNVRTYHYLKRHGYTGPIYIVIDNEDSKAQEYRDTFGDEWVVEFDKEAVSRTVDEADNFTDRRTELYARNHSFAIAKQLGFRYFIQLDDDYDAFGYCFNDVFDYEWMPVHNLDGVFDALIRFHQSTPTLSIALAQGGDFIGGNGSGMAAAITTKRKAMNTFVCDVERPFPFVGRLNDDVNTYCLLGSQGGLFLTIGHIRIHQLPSQLNTGGMSDHYRDRGTYVKSMYSVMLCPSFVTVATMGNKWRRLHHRVEWNAAVPKIIAESHRRIR